MKPRSSRITFLVGVMSGVACLLQVSGLIRYLGRLPGDRIGISLYIVTIVAFALVSIEHFARWRKDRIVERGKGGRRDGGG